MRITIECPKCDAAKRPLQECDACGAAGSAGDVTVWRDRLHARALGVIMAEPRRGVVAEPPRIAGPLHAVIRLDDLISATETLIVPDTVSPPAHPLSFDWDEHRGIRRLRKSA
jgi:hypothetical protein